MSLGITDLLAVMALTDLGDDTVEAENLDIGYHRVFGGQILAQMIAAASERVPEKSVKSMHVVFSREGDATVPMRYRTRTLHSGGTFAAVEIVAHQEPDPTRVVATAVVSLHRSPHPEGPQADGSEADGPEAGSRHREALHRSDDPPVVGSPEEAEPTELHMIPWDTRVVGGVDLADRATGPARLDWWTRTPGLSALHGDAVATHQALLAHSTDLTLIGTALRGFDGLSEADSTVRLQTAVTSHSLWFHQPFRIDDWLLVSQHAPVTSGDRSFGRGDVFAGDELVASFAQESMIRRIPDGRSPR